MEEEILELSRNNGWNSLYADIRRDSSQHDFSALEASRPENRCLNRYRDVYPYDHSRVVLRDHHVDYINASLVKGPESANRAYILAQGPLPTTVGHFWLTVWQEKSKAVLMLNRVMEKGTKHTVNTVSAGFNESVGKKYLRQKTNSLNLDDSLKPNSLNPADTIY